MTLLDQLNRLALRAAQRSDIVIACFMVLAVVMMIIPLPTALVDLLIGLNIGISLLILVVAFYVTHPVEFSSLPSIILLATLFRLALSITTTRLILLDADAGHIVSAFGHFVIAGEVVIGMVVFLIITVAQFLVITKGAERVAEVAARFILDAMPGKQMSIDNDLRNGDIDAAQARTRRQRLERESHLYGAMDGAMKFVKGDAIACLVILFVNLIGGLLIGMLKHGMPFSAAVETYSLLTVGDGLVAQIPALMVSVAAGTVVTRVGSDKDLGSEIVGQLGASSRALGLTAVILFALAWIPGFSAFVFLSLSAALGFAAWVIARRSTVEEASITPLSATGETAPSPAKEHQPAPPPAPSEAQAAPPPVNRRLMLVMGASMLDANRQAAITAAVERHRSRTSELLGIDFPAVGLRHGGDEMQGQFAITLDEVPVTRGELPEGQLLLDDDPLALDMLSLSSRERPPLFGRRAQHWIDADHRAQLEQAGIAYLDDDEVLGRCVAQTLRRYAGEFIGIQETRQLLSAMESDYAELVGEAVRVLSLQRIAEVLRGLAADGVPLRALRAILEAMVAWGPLETQTPVLIERIRSSLARQICHHHAQPDRILPAWVMTRQAEECLRGSRQGNQAALKSNPMRELHDWFTQRLRDLDPAIDPVVVIAADLRQAFQQWMHRSSLDLPVLSWREIAPEFDLQALDQVRIGLADDSQPRQGAANVAER